MSKMIIKCFPADYGDCILVTICNATEKYNILIDCGFTNTYNMYVKNELENLKALDLLVLTHIDIDHIQGAIELFNDKELTNCLDIKDIWFNDIYKLCQNKGFSANLKNTDNNNTSDMQMFDENVGAKQGMKLANYIYESRYYPVWNKDDTIIQCDTGLYKVMYPLNNQIKFVLLSPTEDRIERLMKDWGKKLDIDLSKILLSQRQIVDFYELYGIEICEEVFDENCANKQINIEKLAEEDYKYQSVINNSSIAFFIEYNNKRLLFLGDSNPQDVAVALKRYKIDMQIEDLHFDLVKVSHHGSKNNTNNSLMETITADRFLISTNGEKFGHPDDECLSKIIFKQKTHKELYFNYFRKDITDKYCDTELMTNYSYNISFPDEKKKILNIEV